MSVTRITPVAGRVYSMAEITRLYLLDSPCLRFFHNGRFEYVQNASTDDEHLCATNLKIAVSRWKYEYTTEESVPIFTYAEDNDFPITEVVTIEPTQWVDHHGRPGMEMYVRFIGDYEPELTEFEKEIVADRKANPLPLPVVKEIKEEESKPVTMADAGVAFKAMMDSIMNPPVPTFTADELANEPEKAEQYLLSRPADANKFLSETAPWERVNIVEDKAKLYEVGYVWRHAGWPIWGKLVFNDAKKLPVRFKTVECFAAWVLKTLW